MLPLLSRRGARARGSEFAPTFTLLALSMFEDESGTLQGALTAVHPARPHSYLRKDSAKVTRLSVIR